MESNRGWSPFSIVMTRIEVPSDMKEDPEKDARGRNPLDSFFDHTL